MTKVKTLFKKLLQKLPVCINGLADPAILRESTERKLNTLASDNHEGPVAIVTKGNLDTKWWKERLPHWTQALNLIVFSSVSGLPHEIEPVSLLSRFKTMRVARDAGATVIAYVRPIITGINDSHEILGDIVAKSAENGCHAVVASGFRGDNSVISDSGLQSFPGFDDIKWLPQVKLMKPEITEYLQKECEKLGIGFWRSTHCSIAGLQHSHTLSPYYLAPQFAGCDTCSIKEVCAQGTRKPPEGAIELLRYFGYNATFHDRVQPPLLCNVSVRSNCKYHCLNCPATPKYGVPYIEITRWDGTAPSWGDLSLARFLSGGTPCVGINNSSPFEDSTVGFHPRFHFKKDSEEGSPYLTTSWFMWSEYLPKNKCFRCSYCFVGMYKEHLPLPMMGTVGMSPVRLLNIC